MGKPLLLLRLEGPLQSWGLRSQWDVRDTGDEPSKSGIIGLLGCALGYSSGDRRLEELDGELTLAVRVEHPGERLLDFQTVTGIMPLADGKYKGTEEEPNTIISPRAYLQDAAFLVALAGPPETLARCADALRAPRWPVFLGRKACPPARPLLPVVTDEYENLAHAVAHHPWTRPGRPNTKGVPERLRVVVEDPRGNAVRPDRIQANPARMYGSRAVRVEYVSFPGEEKEEEPCTSPV